MPTVLLDIAMSPDGFVAVPNDEDHGLHNYFFSPSGVTREVIEEAFKTTGTIIMRRRSYETVAAQDGFAKNPYQVPAFIITHHAPEKLARGAESFVFVTDEFRSKGGAVETALVDALDEQAVDQYVDKVVELAGRIDISFNVIGYGDVREALLKISVEDFLQPIMNAMRTHNSNELVKNAMEKDKT